MKKFFKAASILAAVSMMFAFASCQQDPETPATSGTAPVFKAETKTVDLSSLGVTSITEAKVADEKIATVKADGAKVTVKSVAKGTAKITAKVTGADSKTGTVDISVTVAETGKITVSGTSSVKWDEPETPTKPETPTEPVDPPASENTITLDFGALRDDIKAQNLFTDGTKLSENKTYVTSGVTLNFLASGKYAFKYNQTVGLTIKGDAFKITGIEGSYDAVVTWAIAGQKAAGDRNLSVNGGTAVDNADTRSATSAVLVDNVCSVENATGNLTFNASNEVVIKTIVITKK